MKLSFLYFLTLISFTFCEKFYYEGYKVYQVIPKTLDEARLLSEFEHDENFDFWTDLRALNAPVDIMVTPHAQSRFEAVLENEKIEYSTINSNVAEGIKKEENRRRNATRIEEGEVTFTDFMRHDEILAYLDRLAADYPSVATTEVIGKSFEGRNLKLIKISTGGSNKPIIYIQATIHAREWIAPPVALYILHQLLENGANSDMYRDIDWIIHPVVNPDGYEYTHTDARLWRKTRSPGTICYGADGNRNFNFNWMVMGASNWQCTDTYAGYSSFSEVETRFVRDIFDSYKGRIKLYVDVHSYGRLFMHPWGFTSDPPENFDEVHDLGLRFNASVAAVRGTTYAIGNSFDLLYAVGGGSRDYAAAIGEVNLSYTLELPAGSIGGFEPEAWEILPVVTEIWEGFKVLYEHVQEHYVD